MLSPLCESQRSDPIQACGSVFFAVAILGWYLLLIQMLGVMGFSLPLPVGDFSGFWAKRAAKKASGDHEA